MAASLSAPGTMRHYDSGVWRSDHACRRLRATASCEAKAYAHASGAKMANGLSAAAETELSRCLRGKACKGAKHFLNKGNSVIGPLVGTCLFYSVFYIFSWLGGLQKKGERGCIVRLIDIPSTLQHLVWYMCIGMMTVSYMSEYI